MLYECPKKICEGYKNRVFLYVVFYSWQFLSMTDNLIPKSRVVNVLLHFSKHCQCKLKVKLLVFLAKRSCFLQNSQLRSLFSIFWCLDGISFILVCEKNVKNVTSCINTISSKDWERPSQTWSLFWSWKHFCHVTVQMRSYGFAKYTVWVKISVWYLSSYLEK